MQIKTLQLAKAILNNMHLFFFWENNMCLIGHMKQKVILILSSVILIEQLHASTTRPKLCNLWLRNPRHWSNKLMHATVMNVISYHEFISDHLHQLFILSPDERVLRAQQLLDVLHHKDGETHDPLLSVFPHQNKLGLASSGLLFYPLFLQNCCCNVGAALS